MESHGLLLQKNGSTHRWFDDKKPCLIALIDSATSEVHAELCVQINLARSMEVSPIKRGVRVL